jgi:8-amino-7-oxononanoate synthase
MLKFQQKLAERKLMGSERSLSLFQELVDFCSNDYIGLSKHTENELVSTAGSTGSRLISGNSNEAIQTEKFLADFFETESALIFNSGYDANLGIFSAVPQRGDIILYDELIHASMRDGIRLSHAKAYAFKHNNWEDLARKLKLHTGTVFVAIESIYSMDGDIAPIANFVEVCAEKKALLIVDEAHACGVFGDHGRGICAETRLKDAVFARIITFGKAYGTHGAAIVGSSELTSYLINFARSFIYTTALPPYQYKHIEKQIQRSIQDDARKKLQENIALFRNYLNELILPSHPNSPIQIIRYANIQMAQELASILQSNQFAVKAILSPTVPEGQERLRICLHAFNTKVEIEQLCKLILQHQS